MGLVFCVTFISSGSAQIVAKTSSYQHLYLNSNCSENYDNTNGPLGFSVWIFRVSIDFFFVFSISLCEYLLTSKKNMTEDIPVSGFRLW